MALDYSKFRLSDDEDALFDVAPFDYEGGRKKLIARIVRAGKQLRKEQALTGGKDFDIGYGNRVRLRLTLNGQRIYIQNEGENYFPVSVDGFSELESAFIENVNAGEYDAQIEKALSGGGSAAPAASKPAAKAAGKKKGSGFPSDQCSYWESLTQGERQGIGRLWGMGKNPDGSSRAEVGDKPNAPYAGPSKKKK